jgi:hypothetical protein
MSTFKGKGRILKAADPRKTTVTLDKGKPTERKEVQMLCRLPIRIRLETTDTAVTDLFVSKFYPEAALEQLRTLQNADVAMQGELSVDETSKRLGKPFGGKNQYSMSGTFDGKFGEIVFNSVEVSNPAELGIKTA